MFRPNGAMFSWFNVATDWALLFVAVAAADASGAAAHLRRAGAPRERGVLMVVPIGGKSQKNVFYGLGSGLVDRGT